MDKATVTCEICGKQFKRITHKHLKHHNTTLDEYQTKYPNTELISAVTLKKFSTNKEDHWIEKYGDEGKQRYKEYKMLLAEKNTFEYKRKKYGWTKQDFDDYNAARASTLENFQLRHGKELGLQRWNEYTAKQKRAGVSLDWFVKKYGQKMGTQVWEQVCRSKSHSLENYIKKYGEEGKIRYEAWLGQIASNQFLSSGPEKEMINVIEQIVPPKWTTHSLTTKQYVKWSNELNRAVMYDWVATYPKKVCIEFNGDYWHCNPNQYSSTFFHPHIKKYAEQIWEIDNIKKRIMENQGFTYIVVWEKEWREDKATCIRNIKECLM